MSIFLFLVISILISHAKLAQPGTFQKDYTDRKQTNMIKGIFVVLVFFSHCMQYIHVHGVYDKPYLTFRSHLGQMVVAMFLFYSGFGMMKSVMEKGFSYLKTFPKRRFFKVWIHFAFAICLFWLMNVCLGIHYDWKTIFLAFTGWTGIGNSNWYMFVILMVYILFFFSFFILKWMDKKGGLYLGMILFTFSSIAFVYWEMWMGQPSWFYNTVILFALGGWYALFQDKMERIVMKNDMVYLLLTTGMTFLYWLSFTYRKKGIEFYSLWAVVFTMLLVMATMKIQINSTVFEWMGQHVFSIYILQRIPMTILSVTGFVNGSPYAFVVLAFISTLGLGICFDSAMKKIDITLFGKSNGTEDLHETSFSRRR